MYPGEGIDVGRAPKKSLKYDQSKYYAYTGNKPVDGIKEEENHVGKLNLSVF